MLFRAKNCQRQDYQAAARRRRRQQQQLLLLPLLLGCCCCNCCCAAATLVAEAQHGINAALTSMVFVENNKLVHTAGGGGAATTTPIETAAQLQDLLDESPNSAIYLRRSTFEVVADGNHTGITIRSNQSLVMDAGSVIFCNSTLPAPLYVGVVACAARVLSWSIWSHVWISASVSIHSAGVAATPQLLD
jgi:hypothetical protein